jgi:hypothetical protein
MRLNGRAHVTQRLFVLIDSRRRQHVADRLLGIQHAVRPAQVDQRAQLVRAFVDVVRGAVCDGKGEFSSGR